MSKITNITNSAMTGNFAIGDNASAVSMGGQTISSKSSLAAFETLSHELRRHGVNDEQIDDLRSAIAADASTHRITEKQFGPAVKVWMKKMMDKAIDSTWQIELGVAGSLLASALQNYYGWFQKG